jgi:hypothetical protein
MSEPSNWRAATDEQLRRRIESLTCPKCGASNRPGVRRQIIEVELTAATAAVCGCCAYAWQPAVVDQMKS